MNIICWKREISFLNLSKSSKSNTFASFIGKKSFEFVDHFVKLARFPHDIAHDTLSIARKKSRSDLFKPKTRARLFTKFFHLHETKSNHFETLEASPFVNLPPPPPIDLIHSNRATEDKTRESVRERSGFPAFESKLKYPISLLSRNPPRYLSPLYLALEFALIISGAQAGKALARKRRHVNTSGIEGAHLRLGERLGEEEMAWHEEARKNTRHRGGEDREAIHAIPRVPLWKRGIWRLEGFRKKKDISESICPASHSSQPVVSH